jgi:hypothetical protein
MTQIANRLDAWKPCGCVQAGSGAPQQPGEMDGDIYVDVSNPLAPVTYIYTDAVGWSLMAAGSGPGLPAATREGQVLIAGAGPFFQWGAGDVDGGRF